MSFIKSKLQTAINNNMKNTFKTLLFISLLCGVSGADEIKSVMEGDSITLQTDENKILTYNKILWWFEGVAIARISDGGKIRLYEDVADGRFKGRLKLDNQTGSLTITNTRTIHSGDYKMDISTNTGTTEKRFTLTVSDSPSVIDPDRSELKSVSVTEGKSVTLNTDIINPHGDELIVWRFGDNGALIAKVYKENNKISYPDERFKDRIHLDQTGSLTITDIRIADTGEYKLKISSNRDTKHKRFSLYVKDSSPDIDPGTTEVKSESVIEGESVSLNTDIINPHGDELIVWRFGDILIAKYDKENNKISFSPDERFKDRIHLDQTGSLIITDIRIADTGEYKLKISSNRDTKHKRFNLYVKDPWTIGAKAEITVAVVAVLLVAAAAAVGVIYYRRWNSELERQKQEQERLKDEWRTVSEMEGESVPLITDDAHIKTDEVNVYYGGTLIAQIRRGKITHVKDDIRKGENKPVTDDISERLELNHQTGSLIINNSRRSDSGVYILKIINRTGEKITYKRIIVIIRGEVITETVMKGDSFSLYTDATPLQKDAEVKLKYENTVIAEKNPEDKMISVRQDALDGKFKLNLKVEQQTGSLSITKIRTDQSGVYELKIISRRATIHKIIRVSFSEQPADGVNKLDVFNIEADDGVNESAGLLNNAADDEVNDKQVTSPV